MNQVFSDYYLFQKSAGGKFYLMCQYGNYEPLDNVAKTAENLDDLRIEYLFLKNLKRSQISLKSFFWEDILGVCHFKNDQNEIVFNLCPKRQTIEFFINDPQKESRALILELITREELFAEVNYMRLRAYSVS